MSAKGMVRTVLSTKLLAALCADHYTARTESLGPELWKFIDEVVEAVAGTDVVSTLPQGCLWIQMKQSLPNSEVGITRVVSSNELQQARFAERNLAEICVGMYRALKETSSPSET